MAGPLGARIRSLREEAKLTQEGLAWDCDLDKSYLSQIEAGKRLPSLTVLAQLAERLEVEVADLVALDMSNPRLQLLDATRRSDRRAVRQILRSLASR